MFNYESLKVVILGKNVCPPIVPSKSFTWNRKDGSLWTEILVFSKCDKCSIDYWLVGTLKFSVISQIDTNVKNGDYRCINYGLHYFLLFCMPLLQDIWFYLIKNHSAFAESWHWKLSTIEIQKWIWAAQSNFDNFFVFR